MKLIFTFLCTSLMLVLNAQDTVYYDASNDVVTSIELATTYSITQRNTSDTNIAIVRKYYKSGEIKSEINYSEYWKMINQGASKHWFEDGQLRWDKYYENDKLDGDFYSYWEDGDIKRHDVYDNGELIEGQVWNADGLEEAYYDFENMPQYPGGIDALFNYIGTTIKYPKKSKRKGIQGKVYVGFVIEKDGKVSNVEVLRSVSIELDDESVRVVKGLADWEPGTQDGFKIRVKYNLPLNFRLN